MKREKQVHESKMMIGDALLKLLKEFELEEIPISKITEEAKVSRMTFYRNFNRKEDIVLFILDSFLKEIRSAVQNLSSPSIKDMILIQFRLLRQKSGLVIIQSHEDTRKLLRKFRERSLKAFTEILLDADPYTREFNFGGMDYIMAKWIESGMIESPEEMTEKMIKLIHRSPMK